MVEELHLMEKVHEILVMTLLEMLGFLLLIIVHHLILIIEKNNFLLLDEGSIQDINDSAGAAEKNLELILVKQIQNFA